MRTFIAIDLPGNIKEELAALQGEMRRAGADISWTRPENIHLTLKFLGEIDKKILGEIEQLCRACADRHEPFGLHLHGTGFFPNPRHPRVLWAGLAGAVEAVEQLQEEIDAAMEALGFEREEKDFRPHLTLGRIRSNKNIRELQAIAESYSLPELSFEVGEVVIMKSDLHPQGASYSQLATIKI